MKNVPNFFKKLDSCSALGVHSLSGGALTTFPCECGPEKKFYPPWGGLCAPNAPPGYAYVIRIVGDTSKKVRNNAGVVCRNEEGDCEYSGFPQEYNHCVKAHSSDELEEWHRRVSYRQAKLRISQQNSSADSTYQNVMEFRSEVHGAEVTCDGSLEVHLTEKTASCTWIFHIEVL